MKGFLTGRNIESCIHDLIPHLKRIMGDKINPTGQWQEVLINQFLTCLVLKKNAMLKTLEN